MKEKILSLYKKLPPWSKNRYFISFLFFFIWIFFFDTNSVLTQIDQKQEIKKLKKDIEYYDQEIKKDKNIISILSQDSLTPQLEKYLREKLFLSKENEEVFIIE